MTTEHDELDLAEKLQDECHVMVSHLMAANKKTSHQDATNVWILKKLAEMQERIDKIQMNYKIDPYKIK